MLLTDIIFDLLPESVPVLTSDLDFIGEYQQSRRPGKYQDERG